MIAQFRAELCKQFSIRTNLGLFSSMVALVALVILMHALGGSTEGVARRSAQLEMLGQGERLGALFAALLGAMAMTSEYRHGTIRPTFLTTPRRGQIVTAKVGVSLLIGLGFGLSAAAAAVGVQSAALASRGVNIRLDTSDYALVLAGSAAGAGLLAAIGVGVGAVLRNQVPTLVGICAWLLFVEGILAEDLFGGRLRDVGRFMPGALARAATGLDPKLASGLALLVLALYAAVAAVVGWVTTARRDVA